MADSPRKELVYDHLMFTGEHSACTYNGLVQVGPCDGAGAIRVRDFPLTLPLLAVTLDVSRGG